MSDTLPTIDADQLTKSVCLAAAGTLSAVEAEPENEAVDEWQNNDTTFEVVKADKRNPSLKSLETLSSSVSSDLGKLNHLNLDKSCFIYSPRNIKPNFKNNAKKDTSSTVVKKYSSRKNYKLLPPLIPSQVRTSFKKQNPKVVQQRQLVTLSHCLNVHSPQELKSMPVRPARYTTNYLFVRTAQIVPTVPADKPPITLCAASRSVSSVSPSIVSSSPSITSASPSYSVPSPLPSATAVSSVCTANVSFSVSESPVITATSGTKFPVGTPILFPFPQGEQSQLNIPAISMARASLTDIKQPSRLTTSTKLQPLFRLPFPVNSIPSNIILKAVPTSKENFILNKVKENAGTGIQSSQILPSSNLGDGESTVCHSSSVPTHQTCPPGSPSNPAVNTLKHILVPTPTSEISLLTSFASPVVMTAKLAHSSTLTVSSRSSQPCNKRIISPRSLIVTSEPSCTSSSSSSNIIASSGQVLFASPNFQLIAGKSSLQTYGAPRLRSPVVFTHIANPICKQHNGTLASIVRFASPQSNCTKSLNNNIIPLAKTNFSPNQKSGSGIDQNTDVSINMMSTTTTHPLETSNVASSTILTPTSRTQLLHLIRPLPESLQKSSSLSRQKTESSIFQKVDKLDALNFSKLPRPGLPNCGTVISVSLQSSNNNDPQEKCVVTSPIGLSSSSLVCSSNSFMGSDTCTVSTHDIQANSSSCATKAKYTPLVAHTSFQMTASNPGTYQPNVHAITVTTTLSGQHPPLTLLAAPSRLEQLHRSCLSGTPESNAQPSKQSSSTTQKVELTSEPGNVGSWFTMTPSVIKTANKTTHIHALSSHPSPHKHIFDSLPSSKASPVTIPAKTSASAPLSKEVAAAAMVSLSAMSAFSELPQNLPRTVAQNSSSQSQHISVPSSSITSMQTPPQFLIPSTDRSKLVISAAGIEHLQSLLRKQGISEGYFIITSPRVPPLIADAKLAGTTSIDVSSVVCSNADENKNLLSKDISQKFVAESSEGYTSRNIPVSGFVRMFEQANMNSSGARDENNISSVELDKKEESLDLESEVESDNENSSSYSRSSSAALVIETGEEDEKMEMDRPSSDCSPKDNTNKAREDGLSSSVDKVSSDDNAAVDQHSPKLAQDTTWETESIRSDDARQGIPQSPLSLSDLVRQQQCRPGFSRHLEYSFITSPENKTKEISRKNNSESPRLPSSASHDFQFPMPSCPASSFSTSHQHTGSDIQTSFQHNMFPSHSSFSSDLTFESSVHHMETRINHNMEDVVSNSSPKLISSVVNAASPKSPLSVQSNQALDQITPLNPPMTPNTMLINLLNRVPTPFLTNPQDLLSVPTSQENIVHEADTAGDFEMNSKTRQEMFSGKSIDFTSGQNHTQLNSTEAAGEALLYSESSRNLASNAGSYVPAENALELIASSYAPSSTGINVMSHEINSPQLSSSFTMIGSKSFSHSSYTQCNIPGEPHTLNFSESFQQESEGRDICNSFHCKSCSGPLLVTVNLDPEFPKYVVTHPEREEKAPESLLGTYGHSNVFDHSLSLQEHGEAPEDSSRMTSEKSRETDILRHLILNTSSTSLHALQPVQNLHSQPYRNQTSSFNMSQSHHSQDTQFECRVESFLEPENQHKTLSGEDINQSGSFNSQDESFLHINHVHTQPSPSYDNSNTSFQTSAHQSYENTVSSSFDNRNTSSLGNQTNASYIMQSNMTSDAAFSVQGMTKSNMAMPHDFMDSDNRLQHLASFRAEDQSALFYQHTDQSGMQQHHYNPTNQHQGLEYHLDNLPSSHQAHQYSSTSLSHPSSSRMFSDHAENVEYLNSQYQTQYYDSGGVAPSLPLFPQQCVVGSEAPVIGNTAEHPCNIPFSSAPRGLQLEFRFPPDEDDDDGNNIEKQPVLPSASFSPPSVADQAANTDPGGMSMYHGSFPNLNMYDMYMRGGSGDARGVVADTVQDSGNFCVECNVMYKAQCKFHPCDYVYVSDTPILSHARLTLPTCLRLGISAVAGHTNNTGVYAKDKIAVRTKFGPLIGSPVSCDKLSSTRSFSLWQTFLGASVKVIDTSDENSSNWLMFLKPARVSLEQNLVAFQHGSSVYFVTRADIEPGQELLYWFAKDYSQMLGITSKSKNAHQQLCPHCPVCKQVFPDRKQVHSHVRLQHPKPCTKKCSHCSRRFSQVSHLNAHITSVHLCVKKFVCPQCGKRFSDSSNFRKHVKSHSDERLFKCPICGKAFRQKAHLKLHMNTHMLVKNEQCGYCGKRFTRAFTRRQHELQHTKLNKIPCAHCNKVFYKQQVYKQHLKIHSNERKYICSHCSRAFRTKANLTRHGPTCKQQKCVVIPPPPSLPSSQIQGDFLRSSHSEVSLSTYSNDASATNESV